MYRDELTSYLKNFFYIEGVEDFSYNGLQVEGKNRLLKVACAVSASVKTIEQAILAGVDALIVHHGIFWKGDSPYITGSLKKKLDLLLHNQISLYAYHLPLDMHREVGNNWRAAIELGWHDLEPFGKLKNHFIGVKAKILPQSPVEFRQMLESYYEHEATFALGGKDQISTVALISGGAYKSIREAAAENIDAFVTGNFDEPAWHMAFEEGAGVNFYALGHSATERVGPRALAEQLKAELNLDCTFIDITNPF